MVAIPSLSGEEVALARWVLDTARQWGVEAEMLGRNVVLRLGRGGRPRLLLCSHLDTVAPVAGWPHDPFVPHERDGRISGLGANDAKGCGAAMLVAVARIAAAPLPGELLLVLSVDEEVGGNGEGLEAVMAAIGPIDAAVIGEPTGLDLCCAQKGLLILEVESTGTARHAAHAHRLPGENAIDRAARAICRLEGFEPAAGHPLLGPVTCHVTMISGGTRRNVIPDEIVRAVAGRCGARVRVLSDRLKPFATDPDSELVRAARRARPSSRLVGSATMSDAVWTRHVPTLKVGPGQSERSHTAGEYVTREELAAGVELYSELIQQYLAAAVEPQAVAALGR
jgi:acetylornithine deacetylase